VERIDSPLPSLQQHATENLTPDNSPRMFPYTVGETKGPAEQEGKQH